MMYYLGDFQPKPLVLPPPHHHHVIIVGKRGGGIIRAIIHGLCFFLGLIDGLERERRWGGEEGSSIQTVGEREGGREW